MKIIALIDKSGERSSVSIRIKQIGHAVYSCTTGARLGRYSNGKVYVSVPFGEAEAVIDDTYK